MTLNQHLKALQYKHLELEKLIANENKRPVPDTQYLRLLKIRKLHIKEEIASLKS
jgi:hypothetical protein